MTVSPSRFLASCVIAVVLATSATAADNKKLSEADKTLLDGLFKQFLPDPTGGRYVKITAVRRSVWAKEEPMEVEGWLHPASAGKPAHIDFADGDRIPALKSEQMTPADFVADYRAKHEGNVIIAAWLYRLGHEDLAADCMARSTEPYQKDVSAIRKQLAWSAFADMVHAYMVRADEEALRNGERLLKLFAPEAEKYPQGKAVVADLKRRQQKGTFGKAPPKEWPAGFKQWDANKKVAYLIDALDEVDQRQFGQPGGVDLARDRRVSALIEIGEAAVPALIDTVEKDRRLTRSVHFFRDFAQSRTVMSVREAALVAAMSIMQVQAFESEATGDDFTSRGDEMATKTAARLREYWKKYGGTPFDERMMKVLTDPKSEPKALREAAQNIATGNRRARGTTMTLQFPMPERGPNPAIAKFKNPTAAEAILAAMDRDLQAYDTAKPEAPAAPNPQGRRGPSTRQQMEMRMLMMQGGGDVRSFERQMIENQYLGALARLNDKRIGKELVKRSEQAKNPAMRRRFAMLCQQFDEPGPVKAFAEEFRQGTIKLPPDKRAAMGFGTTAATAELQNMVQDLIAMDTPETEKALMAVADPGHPYHDRAFEAVLNGNTRGFGEGAWYKHRLAIALLQDALSNKADTGSSYQIEDGALKTNGERGRWQSGPIPAVIRDESSRKKAAAIRICDIAGEKIGELVIGIPAYHPLLKNADARLEELQRVLSRYTFRPATPGEMQVFGGDSFRTRFVPNIEPLTRPATADDVTKGKAVFQLDGKGKLTEPQPPLQAVLKNAKPPADNEDNPRRFGRETVGGVLIVQAEVGADGKVQYGIITPHEIRIATADELKDVKPVPQIYQMQGFMR